MGLPILPVGHIPLVQPHRVKPDKARGQLLLHILETGLEDLSVLWIFEIVGVVLPELYQPAHLRKNFSGLDRASRQRFQRSRLRLLQCLPDFFLLPQPLIADGQLVKIHASFQGALNRWYSAFSVRPICSSVVARL